MNRLNQKQIKRIFVDNRIGKPTFKRLSNNPRTWEIRLNSESHQGRTPLEAAMKVSSFAHIVTKKRDKLAAGKERHAAFPNGKLEEVEAAQ